MVGEVSRSDESGAGLIEQAPAHEVDSWPPDALANEVDRPAWFLDGVDFEWVSLELLRQQEEQASSRAKLLVVFQCGYSFVLSHGVM